MTVTDEMAPVLVVRRQMAVPRQRVFDAWLDSESMAHWMRPGKVTHSTVELEPRVGGSFRIQMHGGDGECFDHRGEYLAIEPPSLLSFTWISEGTDHEADCRHHRVSRAWRRNRAGPHPPAAGAEGDRGTSERVDRRCQRARRDAVGEKGGTPEAQACASAGPGSAP